MSARNSKVRKFREKRDWEETREYRRKKLSKIKRRKQIYIKSHQEDLRDDRS